MLKNILAAGVVFVGASAHAQNLSFDTNVSFEMVSATFKPAEAYSVATQTQFSVRNFELQADFLFSGTYNTPLFPEPDLRHITIELSVLGVHGAYRVSDNFRIGGFGTYMFIPSTLKPLEMTLGGEAMLSFGRTDIEVAAAYDFPLNTNTSPQSGHLFLAAYHTVNSQLELSLESTAYVTEYGPVSRIITASANVKYTLPNLPLSLKVGVQNAYFTWQQALTSVRVAVLYDFGAPSDFRAFTRRGFDAAALTVAARP